MPNEETRRVLELFGGALTGLEDALDQHRPANEIYRRDAELADRTREMLALIDRVRSRRIG